MIGPRPKFMDSPYFVMEEDNWHLKPGAPAETVKEFEEFMKELNHDDSEPEKPVRKSMTDRINEMLEKN